MNTIHKLTKKHIRIITMGIVLILALLCFEEIVDDVFSDPTIGDPETLVFDKTVLKFFQAQRSLEWNQSMTDITALGSLSVIALLTTILVVLLVTQKDWIGLFYIFLIMLGSSIIPAVLKDYFMRERPDELGRLAIVKSHSFPSGHSFSATVAYFAMAYLVSREIKNIKLEILYYMLAAIVVALVGTSRMYLGVHYPTDIFAGICLGISWFIIVSVPFVYASKRRVDNENI